jgi:hypothetical protein
MRLTERRDTRGRPDRPASRYHIFPNRTKPLQERNHERYPLDNRSSIWGVTSIYLQGIDSAEIIQTVHSRPAPVISATSGLRAAP